ncbi:DUF5615 family PIN-like protein [Candidatus Nephthysia bennettiae]
MDQNMVEPVADLLNGRGHLVTRVRDVGLSDATDEVISEYALTFDLVIVTFDRDFRNSARRRGARCLHIRPPELNAADRLRKYFDETIELLGTSGFVVLPPKGSPTT